MRTTPKLDLAHQLSTVPVRNQRVVALSCPPATTPVLEVALQYPVWMIPLRMLLKMPARKRFQLDPIGQQVYDSIDGQKTFENLIDAFAAEHQLTFFESRGLLMAHIQNLMKSNLVAIGIKRQPLQDAPDR